MPNPENFQVSDVVDRGDDKGVSASASQEPVDLKTSGTPGGNIEEEPAEKTTDSTDSKGVEKQSEERHDTTEERLQARKEADATAKAAAKAAEKVEPEQKTEAKAEDTTAEEDIVELETITRLPDGTYEYRIEPENPKSTVYTGATPDEALRNARKGFLHKDEFIRKSKEVKPLAISEERRTVGEEEGLGVKPPDEEAIYLKHFQAQKVSSDRMRWTLKDWETHQSENSLTDFAVYDEKNKYERSLQTVHDAAQAEIADGNVRYINNMTLEDESIAAEEFLSEHDINPDDIGYDDILAEVFAEDKNFNENGVLRPARITLAVVRKVQSMLTEKTKTTLTKKLDEEVAKGNKLRARVTAESGGKKTFIKPSSKEAQTVKEATANALRELRAG